MSLISRQTFLSNPKFHFAETLNHFTPFNLNLNLKPPNLHFFNRSSKVSNPNFKTNQFHLKAFNFHNSIHSVDDDHFNFDKVLAVSEFLCLGSSAIVAMGFVVSSAVSGPEKAINVWLGDKMVVWQVVVLVIGVVIGAWIRKRQWRRICREEKEKGGVENVNLIGRIEKLEDDLSSAVTLIRALSRQLEKLGIRFRLTRKSLKDPIAETAALSQKNSEATRALAAQGDILENELSEIQKVLLAMQGQQQKQLELILAIAKAGKLFDNKQRTGNDKDSKEPRKSAEEEVQKDRPLIQTSIKHSEIENDQN